MKVIKRDGRKVEYNSDKIVIAISNANKEVGGKDKISRSSIEFITKYIESLNKPSMHVEEIQDIIERKLMEFGKFTLAKKYILYRDKHAMIRQANSTDESILTLVRNANKETMEENSNKNAVLVSTQRDLIAGECSKDLADRVMLPERIVKAHNDGVLHFHDKDYFVQPMHNCDLIDVDNMCTYGFQMGTTLIEPNDETSFETACNLMAQINLQVSGRQYGGQTVSWSHMLRFIQNSRNNIRKRLIEDYKELGVNVEESFLNEKVEKLLREEIYRGVKIYQYQVLCHSSSNGQTPFVSNNLCLREAETQQELDDFAMLIEEIFKRRKKGVKDASGHYVTPLFPKLLYWTCDGLNVKKEDPYFYLTELAAECEIKRTQPDIVSEKETRRVKQGQIIPSMGCRSLLGPIWEEHTYPINTKFYWKEGEGEYRAYPYNVFVEKRTFECIPNGEYKDGYECGEYVVNFRGNTGWLIKKTDTEVTILQPIVYGRFNQGVVTINLPHVALESKESGRDFFELLDERLQLCREALWTRNTSVKNIKAKNIKVKNRKLVLKIGKYIIS